ncbi:MAG: hypothetical protein IPK68_10090 [Bdellovibrionales bacterium]|nr:hypothetical protein [Bdellovibrionales bacterium]
MIWFKHLTNSSSHNQLISRVEDMFGLEGYARTYKVIEVIVSQMTTKDSVPSIEYPVWKWCEILGCKSKNLNTFLMYLRYIGVINCKRTENGILVTFLKLSDLLDNRAVSSRLRGSAGYPRTDQKLEENISEQKENVDDAGDDFFWMTETLKGSNAKRDLPPLVLKHWLSDGFNEVEVAQIAALIRRQFSASEKANRTGEVIISEIEKLAMIAKVIETVPSVLRGKIPEDFFEGITQYLHLNAVHFYLSEIIS